MTEKANAKPIPEGYHALTPYLTVRGGAKALEFYRDAFGAEELYRMEMPGGNIGHAEMRIGDSTFMLADENEAWGNRSPLSLGGSATTLLVYVEDVDELFQRTVEAGAEVVKPVENHFYGDRAGTVKDPFGHVWMLSTHVEDVPPEEMERRMQEMMSQA